jgi:predicted nucleotidyltransferase
MGSRPAPDFAGLLAAITRELEARGLPFLVIGGQAVLLHGRPRLTEDIDLTLGVDPSALPRVLAACATLGLSPLPTDVEPFVAETYVLPARHGGTRIRVDFIFSSTTYEQQAIGRAVRVVLDGTGVPFASAEDLLIHKLFAARPRDMEDALGVVRRKGAELDWAYMEQWSRVFAEVPGRESMPDRLAELRRMSAE